MILESYDKYEYEVFDCGGYSPSQIIRHLNLLGQEGYRVIQSYGDIFHNNSGATVLLERKITCEKVS